MVSLALANPDFRRSATSTATHDRVAEGLLFSQIIGATFLQKLAIPIGGDSQIYIGLLVMLGTALAGLALRRLTVSGTRFALLAFMTGGLTLTQLLGGQDFSTLSLLLLIVVHIPYIFRLKSDYMTRSSIALDFFQKVATILAILGILQYAGQRFIPWQYLFPLDSQLPSSLLFQGFHGLNPIGRLYKSTGVFLLEPSIFSQILALAILIEIVRGGSWVRGLIYSVALYFTFSGTGLILLGLLLPILLLHRRRYGWFFLLFVGMIAGLWWKGFGTEQLARVSEFSNTETSAYARFISIFRLIHDVLLPQAQTLFFGMGAGSIKTMVGHFNYALHDPSWGKIVFEYGLIGALVYFPLMIAVFVTARCSRTIKAALAIQFLFLGEYILSPTVHGLVLSFLAWPSTQSDNKNSEERHHDG